MTSDAEVRLVIMQREMTRMRVDADAMRHELGVARAEIARLQLLLIKPDTEA